MPDIRLPAGFGITTLFILTALVMRVAVDQPDGRLQMTVLDVGGGDAVLIRGPTGGFVLVDGGPSPMALSDALGRRLSPLERQLDWIVIGGTEEEQIGGLAGTIERFQVGNILLAGPPRRGAYRRLMDELAEAGTPVMHATAGQWLDLGGGARLEVVAVGEQGAILLLNYGNARILLTPGADPESVDDLIRNGHIGEVHMLMLADGGYEAVNPPDWLEALNPWLALISVEAGNPRGLPSPQVRKALERTTVLRTDQNGWIELVTDGEWLWVEVERQ
jgi:competence protein ComEC